MLDRIKEINPLHEKKKAQTVADWGVGRNKKLTEKASNSFWNFINQLITMYELADC